MVQGTKGRSVGPLAISEKPIINPRRAWRRTRNRGEMRVSRSASEWTGALGNLPFSDLNGCGLNEFCVDLLT